MPTTFEILRDEARRQGTDSMSRGSIKWFRQNVKKMVDTSPEKLLREDPGLLVNSVSNLALGNLYMAFYSPKHKKTLPYYDRFPLLLPLDIRKDRSRNEAKLLALNLHYINPTARARLLGELFDNLNNMKMDKTTRMLVTYGTLKAASKIFAPTVKTYIPSHFRSRFLRIPSTDWMTAVFLPVESFEKATKQKVWGDATAQIGRFR